MSRRYSFLLAGLLAVCVTVLSGSGTCHAQKGKPKVTTGIVIAQSPFNIYVPGNHYAMAAELVVPGKVAGSVVHAGAGHHVEFLIEKVPGSGKFVSMGTVKTGANGIAILDHKLGPNFPIGLHRVQVHYKGNTTLTASKVEGAAMYVTTNWFW